MTHRIRRARRRFVQKSFPLGAEQYFRWNKALAAAEAMEDEELSRKLSLRKSILDVNILIYAVNVKIPKGEALESFAPGNSVDCH